MKNKTALILLSGGLDSLVSIEKSDRKIIAGILFDYGQKAFKQEKIASEKIADFYGFELKIINLDWLKNIIDNGLTASDKVYKISDFNNEEELINSMKSVWVPNRNALFINIAAAYCEAKNIDSIVIGANKEEGRVFKDNSKPFIEKINELLKYSVNTDIEVIAPLIDLNKNEIIKEGMRLKSPLELLYSCYLGGNKHCGECESCLHLKNALIMNNREDLIKKLF